MNIRVWCCQIKYTVYSAYIKHLQCLYNVYIYICSHRVSYKNNIITIDYCIKNKVNKINNLIYILKEIRRQSSVHIFMGWSRFQAPRKYYVFIDLPRDNPFKTYSCVRYRDIYKDDRPHIVIGLVVKNI
jgi:hypothetical protein